MLVILGTCHPRGERSWIAPARVPTRARGPNRWGPWPTPRTRRRSPSRETPTRASSQSPVPGRHQERPERHIKGADLHRAGGRRGARRGRMPRACGRIHWPAHIGPPPWSPHSRPCGPVVRRSAPHALCLGDPGQRNARVVASRWRGRGRSLVSQPAPSAVAMTALCHVSLDPHRETGPPLPRVLTRGSEPETQDAVPPSAERSRRRRP